MASLSSIGEDQCIREITKHLPCLDNVVLGAGDDCAVLKNDNHFTLLKTDTIIEGVHYLAEENPVKVGWKAVARVVSDFAAMGGKPDALVIALALHPDTELDYVKSLYQGMQKCAEAYAFSIVGGETSNCEKNVITVSGTGKCNHYVTRSGGNPGDFIYVTGRLGGSIQGKHLSFLPRIAEAEWLLQHLSPTAMMDLSDGLGKDLPRLADASGTGYFLDFSSIPCSTNCTVEQAIGDGEDYELLFTSPIEITHELLDSWKSHFPTTDLTCIGKLTAGEKSPLTGGWEHFC